MHAPKVWSSLLQKTSRSVLQDERGNVLAAAAIAIPLMLGSAGLAVDVTQWTLLKAELRAAADSGAIAGVYAKIQGSTASTAVAQDLNIGQLPPDRSVQVEDVPDDPLAVRVRISVPAQLSFSSLFLKRAPLITAEAVATVVETTTLCTLALSNESETGVLVERDSTLDGDCAVASNASSSDSIKVEGSGAIASGRTFARGDVTAAEGAVKAAKSNSLEQEDPLRGTEPPLVPNSGCPNVTVNPDGGSGSGGRAVLEPGCYGNVVLNGPVLLQDGEYILSRGNLIVGEMADVKCRACSIFLTSDAPGSEPGSIGRIDIHSHAKVDLAAPTQGPNAGVLLYQDRNAGNDRHQFENIISGNSRSRLDGLIYIPSEAVAVDGSMNPNFECARFIGSRVIFRGRVLISKSCSSDEGIQIKAAEVRVIS